MTVEEKIGLLIDKIVKLQYEYCSKCQEEDCDYCRVEYCGADMRNTIKPKSCFECGYSVDYSDDTVMCSEIKNMVSTSQNHNMIPPFCPKYVVQI